MGFRGSNMWWKTQENMVQHQPFWSICDGNLWWIATSYTIHDGFFGCLQTRWLSDFDRETSDEQWLFWHHRYTCETCMVRLGLEGQLLTQRWSERDRDMRSEDVVSCFKDWKAHRQILNFNFWPRKHGSYAGLSETMASPTCLVHGNLQVLSILGVPHVLIVPKKEAQRPVGSRDPDRSRSIQTVPVSQCQWCLAIWAGGLLVRWWVIVAGGFGRDWWVSTSEDVESIRMLSLRTYSDKQYGWHFVTLEGQKHPSILWL